MNILTKGNKDALLPAFTWTWLIGSIIVSSYFAFSLFPSVYSDRTSVLVRVLFETENEQTGHVTYYPNTPKFKEAHRSKLSDKKFLYFTACEILPLSQRAVCDRTRNWKIIDPTDLGCADVVGCEKSFYKLSEELRHIHYADLKPKSGGQFGIDDLANLSISNPIGWGIAAQWPLFFISLFLALKLGRALGEFLFLPYEK